MSLCQLTNWHGTPEPPSRDLGMAAKLIKLNLWIQATQAIVCGSLELKKPGFLKQQNAIQVLDIPLSFFMPEK